MKILNLPLKFQFFNKILILSSILLVFFILVVMGLHKEERFSDRLTIKEYDLTKEKPILISTDYHNVAYVISEIDNRIKISNYRGELLESNFDVRNLLQCKKVSDMLKFSKDDLNMNADTQYIEGDPFDYPGFTNTYIIPNKESYHYLDISCEYNTSDMKNHIIDRERRIDRMTISEGILKKDRWYFYGYKVFDN